MELVVATSLMVALMLGMWGMVKLFTDLSTKGAVQAGTIRTATQLLDHLRRDLQSVALPGESPSDPAFRGTAHSLALRCLPPPSLEWLGRAESPPQRISQLPWGAPGDRFSSPPQAARTADAAVSLNDAVETPRDGAPAGTRDLPDPLAGFEATPSLVRRIRYYPFLPPMAETSASKVPTDGTSPSGFGMGAGDGAENIPAQSARSQVGVLSRKEAAQDPLRLAIATTADLASIVRRAESLPTTQAALLGVETTFQEVQAIRFQYFDGRRWTSWWNSAYRGRLPEAVQIETWIRGANPFAPPRRAELPFAAGAEPRSNRAPADDPARLPPEESERSAGNETDDPLLSADAPAEDLVVPDRPADLTLVVAL
jgi:hypothetical protein